MHLSRRHLLRNAAVVTAGFAGLRNITGCASTGQSAAGLPLKPDPKKLFDLPEGFTYTAFSHQGEVMDDGLYVPGKHDGMAAFEGPGGKTILIRNHELDVGDKEVGPFGKNNELLERPDQHRFYDFGKGKKPGLGGTTTLIYNTKERRLEKHWLSLTGTLRNCAGGVTPWNTWITCEETMSGPDGELEKEHGYNFEVPALAKGLVKAVPLKEMGRFNHEAIAVDPKSGVVYETEDRGNSLIYRYLPNEKNRMERGGKLEALRIKGRTVTDTRNWFGSRKVREGDVFDVDWVDVSDFDPGEDELRVYGHYAHGCARFARGEGMWYGRDAIYFACTTGGNARKGQIWRYFPSQYEGTSEEESAPGRLELFVEPNDNAICENADNLCVAPWGDLFLCEDNDGKATPDQYLLGVTPTGHVYRFGRNALNHAELAGVCFSPDGSTLFVNIYTPGITLAITGPWEQALKDVSRKSMALVYNPI